MTTEQLTVLVAWEARVIDMDTACAALGLTPEELIDLEHAAIAEGRRHALSHVKALATRRKARIMTNDMYSHTKPVETNLSDPGTLRHDALVSDISVLCLTFAREYRSLVDDRFPNYACLSTADLVRVKAELADVLARLRELRSIHDETGAR